MSPAMNWADRKKIASEATSTFTPLDPAVYSFIIKELPKAAEKNGFPNYTINPAVESGPRANARVFHTFYTTEKANGMRFFFDSLKAIGIPEEFFDTNPSDAQICAALQGKRFTAEVYNDEYNGKVYQKLRKFAPPVGPSVAAGPGGMPGPGVPAAAPVVAAAPVQAAPAVAQAAPANPWGNVVAAPPANPFG